MATNSHNRAKARKAIKAAMRARNAIVASNLAIAKPERSFAPNGLATCRQPWGDHGVRIGQNVRGETVKVKPTFVATPQGERHSWPVTSAKTPAGAAYVRNLQSGKGGKQSD